MSKEKRIALKLEFYSRGKDKVPASAQGKYNRQLYAWVTGQRFRTARQFVVG
jgi:hypothetical protein